MRKVIAINGSPRKNANTGFLKKLNGKVEQLVCTDTWQFDDYSKYEASNFDAEKKKEAREKIFPKDCKKAYEIGKRIAVMRERS